MVLRKITIDNSVRFIPKSEETRDKKPNITKNKKQSEQIQLVSEGGEPNARKQNKKFSQNNEKFLEKETASGFKHLK